VTKRERVRDAIAHGRTDIVPYNIELTGEELAKVASYIGLGKDQFASWAGNHIEKVSCNIGGSSVREGYFMDEFGVIWNRSGLDKDIGVVDEVRLKDPDFGSYVFPEPDTVKIHQIIDDFIATGRDTYKFAKLGMAYYERAWSLRGMENLLADFLLEPAFVEGLFERILQYNLAIIDAVLGHDIDGFYFGDDYGQQTGMIMSPAVWRRFIKPGLAEMFGRVKRSGKTVALHSCGNIREIMGDLIDIGLDVYQTLQPEVYDIEKIKMDYGSDLAFWGGISTQKLLPYASPAELKAVVRKTIAILGEGGGYIASPTHQVPSDVPPQNIVVLAEVLRHQPE
jgi:uroporphyrinogen decarboxylase